MKMHTRPLANTWDLIGSMNSLYCSMFFYNIEIVKDFFNNFIWVFSLDINLLIDNKDI